MDCVHIEDEVAARDGLALRIGKQSAQRAAKNIAPLSLEHKVEAVDALEPCNRRGCRAKDAYLVEMRGAEPAAQRRSQCRSLFERPALNDDIGKHARWRVVHPAAELEFLGHKARVI